MPLRVTRNTETHPFQEPCDKKDCKDFNSVDEHSKPVPDATYTVWARMSQDATTDYAQAVGQMRLSDDGSVQRDPAQFRGIEDALVSHGLVSWSGVEDDQGVAIPIERWRELPPEYASQIVQLLQRKLLRQPPNGKGPSGKSSKAALAIAPATSN